MTQTITFPDDVFLPSVTCGGVYKQEIYIDSPDGSRLNTVFGEASIHGTDREDYIKIFADALNNVPSEPLTLYITSSLTWENNDYHPVESVVISITLDPKDDFVGNYFDLEVTPISGADPSITVFNLNQADHSTDSFDPSTMPVDKTNFELTFRSKTSDKSVYGQSAD